MNHKVQLTDDTAASFESPGSFSFVSRKLATSICLLFRTGMKRSPPILEGVIFLVLPAIKKYSWLTCRDLLQLVADICQRLRLHEDNGQVAPIPGVLLGVFDELCDTLADFPGDKPLRAAFDELAFLCHLAIGPFVMGISSFRILWMSFSNPNCAILSRF